MKASSSVCLFCRHRVATGGVPRATQWQASVSHFSSTTPTSASAANAHTASDDKIRRVIAPTHRGRPRNQLSQDDARRPAPSRFPDRIDALFRDIVQTQDRIAAQHASNKDEVATSNSVDLELVKAIHELERMVDYGTPEAAFNYLKQELYPATQQDGVYVPTIFYAVVSRLLVKVSDAKRKDMSNMSLPSVADIFRTYADIGQSDPKKWAPVVADLVKEIMNLDLKAKTTTRLSREKQDSTRQTLLLDLVESWKVLSKPNVVGQQDTGNADNDGFWLPKLDKFSLHKYHQTDKFAIAFSRLFPRYQQTKLGVEVPILAIITYMLLLDGHKTTLAARGRATRFLSGVAYLIIFTQLRETTFRKHIKDTYPALDVFVKQRWPTIKADLQYQLMQFESTALAEKQSFPDAPPPRGLSEFDAPSIKQRLAAAYKFRNPDEVDRLWKEFVGPTTVITEKRAEQMKKHPELINSFISTRLSLDQPNQAVVVWGIISQIGLQPTLKTWNVMLDGCKKARNVKGINNLWAKLVSSGIQLDIPIWTTRISGLIESGAIQAGVRALEEMTKLWRQKSAGSVEVPAAVQPSIEPVNAALSGLIKMNQLGPAGQLLDWAGRHGIEPDIFTFNTLLRPLIRAGNRDQEVQNLFTMMKARGVQADAATFTIILDATFPRAREGHLVSEEQAQEMVSRVLSQMRANGLATNMQTYGKIIHLLLSSGAVQAARGVFEYIMAEGHTPSPHIYTMLIEHYFSGEPDLERVESLLEKRSTMVHHDEVDSVFYERVIKGYATMGRVDKAVDVYRRMMDMGVDIQLPIRTSLLRALLRQYNDDASDGSWRMQEAIRLAEDTRRRVDKMEGKTVDLQKHAFWRIVRRFGLLANAGSDYASSPIGEDGEVDVEDLLRGDDGL